MTVLSYSTLANLCDHRIGTTDVACPLCGPDRRSPVNRRRRVLRIWHREPGFATYCCQRCGAQGCSRAYSGGDCHLQGRILKGSERDRATRQLDKWLWRRQRPLEGSTAESYLREARGYDGLLPATLGFLPPVRSHYHPALIAAFGMANEIDPGVVELDDVHGIHLTFLKPDGSNKAQVEPNKVMVGPSKGWPLVIAAPNDLLGLAVTEGIEDALSVHQATGLGVWAAGSAGRLPALADKLPAYIEVVTVYAHADEAGQQGAQALANALAGRGIEVFIEGGAQ